MNRNTSLLVTLFSTLTLLIACNATEDKVGEANRGADTQARNLAQQSIIVDTHIDVPYRLLRKWDDVSVSTDGGDFDYPRAVTGGLNAAFMSIYTPAGEEAAGTARTTAEKLIDMVNEIVSAAPDKFAIALSADDVEEHFAAGLISMPLGMENGSPIEGDLANIQHFFDRGIRYITLTHGLSNHISDSSYDDNKQWNGLSEFGVEAVREMNRVGIMVDISHVSDEAFYDTLTTSTAPLIASHSSARHFTPGFERNMSDDMVRALADKGGIIMVNFGSSFLTEDANAYRPAMTEAWEAHVASTGADDAEQRSIFIDGYMQEHPYPRATINDVLDHFDHLVSIAGIDHVGIGSDYDGVGDTLPTGLRDVSTYPALVRGLLDRGYSEFEVSKILGLNILRIWREVEQIAAAESVDSA